MAGKPFTPGAFGHYYRIMPGKNSAIWDSMTTSLRKMAYRGEGTRGFHSIVSIDPSSINSKNIQWLLAFDKVNTSNETREALREVGSYIASEVNARYFDEEGIAPNKWQELAQSTIDWRRCKGYSDGPILQASGDLYDMATSNQAINDIELGRNPRVIMGGSHWPEAKGEHGSLMWKYFTHMGGSVKWNVVPRPFMPQDEGDILPSEERQIKKIFQKHVENLFERI